MVRWLGGWVRGWVDATGTSRWWYDFESWRDVSPSYLEQQGLELEDLVLTLGAVGSPVPSTLQGAKGAQSNEVCWRLAFCTKG